MWSNFITKLTIRALKSKRLSGEQKSKITASLLTNLGAIPLGEIISFDIQGILHINGKKLDVEQAHAFIEGCRILKDNVANKVIDEQLTYEAVKMGVHQGVNADMIMFSKAALWIIQERKKLITSIVNE